MSDLNYNYLVNKAIHRGGEEQKIARAVLDLVAFSQNKDVPSFNLSSMEGKTSKIKNALEEMHGEMTKNYMPWLPCSWVAEP